MKHSILAIGTVAAVASVIAAPAVLAANQTLVTATGWSNADDETAAVNQAVGAVHKVIARPKFVVLFTTVGYDARKILSGVNARFQGAKVFGVTSCKSVVTETGVHRGQHKGAMAIMGLDAPDLAVGVALGAIPDVTRARQVTREVLARAIANAGKRPGEKPSMVLIGSTPGFEERAIEGIESMFGKGVPVYGGSAADDTITGKWLTFGNNLAVPSGVSLALLYTHHAVGGAFACGYLGGHQAGKVTAMKGRVVLKIDNRPAADVYNEWAGGAFARNLKDGSSLLAQSAFMPLAKAIVTRTGEKRFISLHPARIDPKTKGIELFGEPTDGAPLYFVKGNADSLIHRVSAVTRRAMLDGEVKRADIAGGLQIYCAGAMLAVQPRIGEIVPEINGALGGRPFIGAFTFGEQGAFKGYGNFHGNLMTSTVIFGRR